MGLGTKEIRVTKQSPRYRAGRTRGTGVRDDRPDRGQPTASESWERQDNYSRLRIGAGKQSVRSCVFSKPGIQNRLLCSRTFCRSSRRLPMLTTATARPCSVIGPRERILKKHWENSHEFHEYADRRRAARVLDDDGMRYRKTGRGKTRAARPRCGGKGKRKRRKSPRALFRQYHPPGAGRRCIQDGWLHPRSASGSRSGRPLAYRAGRGPGETGYCAGARGCNGLRGKAESGSGFLTGSRSRTSKSPHGL